MDIANFILDILYPRNCIFCNEKGVNVCDECFKTKLKEVDRICHVCKHEVSKQGLFVHTDCADQTKLDGIFSVFQYTKKAKLILQNLKYQRYSDFAKDIARSMSGIFVNLPIGFNFVVPVPIHKNRYEKRGFNQAELIARNLTWNVRNILIRSKDTKPQADLNRDERQGNVKEAFTLAYGMDINTLNGKIILLFDDVYTTGSTLENCASILKTAGVKKVYALTWARD